MTSPPPSKFISRLKPLTIYDLERMSPAQLQRREAEEERERKDWAEQQRRARPVHPADEGAK